MGQILQLEDFAAPDIAVAEPPATFDTAGLKQEAFDSGYKDGWNDAFAEARTEESKARTAIAASLQEMGFTYFEARQHIMGSFKPLITSMVEAVLPQVSQAALVPLIQQEMEKLAQMVEPPIQILCAAANEQELRAMVEECSTVPFEVQVEPTLLPSQVQLQFADGFSAIDTEATIARIKQTIEEFFAPDQLNADLAQAGDQQYA